MEHRTTSPSEEGLTPTIAQPPTNGSIDSATLELLATWRREDATQNEEDVRAAEQDLAEFKKAMNENRTRSGAPLVYP